MLLQQPQHFISAQGNIHLQFSCSMETHLGSPSLHPCSEREKPTPLLRARWTMGSTPDEQRCRVEGVVVGPSWLGGAPKKPLAMTSPVLTASATQLRCSLGKTTQCAGIGVPHGHPTPMVGGILLEIIPQFAEMLIPAP